MRTRTKTSRTRAPPALRRSRCRTARLRCSAPTASRTRSPTTTWTLCTYCSSCAPLQSRSRRLATLVSRSAPQLAARLLSRRRPPLVTGTDPAPTASTLDPPSHSRLRPPRRRTNTCATTASRSRVRIVARTCISPLCRPVVWTPPAASLRHVESDSRMCTHRARKHTRIHNRQHIRNRHRQRERTTLSPQRKRTALSRHGAAHSTPSSRASLRWAS